MKRGTLAYAGAVIAATLVGVGWLLTYRDWRTYHYVDYVGHTNHRWTARVGEHPWWTAAAAALLLLIGAAIAITLLGGRRRLARRLVRPFANQS